MSNDNFDIDSYKKVNERLEEFRTKFPEGMISTFRTDVEGGISFKTVVFRNQTEATNYGSSGVSASDGHSFLPVKTRDSVEKVEEFAETVSLGRALAKLGFGVEKNIASSEEIALFNKNKEVANSKEETTEEASKLKSSRPIKRTSRFGKRAQNA